MKIMFLVPYFHSEELKPYRKFSAGLAFTIESIIKNFEKHGHEVFVYAQSAFSKGYKIGQTTFLPKRIYDIFPLPIYYIKEFIKDTKGQKMSLKYWIHVLSYYLFGGVIEKNLRKINPDVVSIRGVGYITRPYVLACRRTETKYVMSLHGLISFLEGPSVLTTDREKQMEKEAFLEAIYEGHPLTVIASGIKKRMLDELEINECPNIFVVNNGVNKNNLNFDTSEAVEIKKRYNISDEDKVIISAAHITERKNQIQILRAYKLLPDEIKMHTKVLFLGTGDMEDILRQEIEKDNLQDKIFICGFVDNKRIGAYYAVANVNVVASKDEGFGRAFVEGFLYGVPAVAFSDLDAIKDLYSESAMILVDERSDAALANGLERAVSANWSKDKIYKHGDKFSVEHMVENYEQIYKDYVGM
ncbi:glycosyltransferase family 4 protein [Lactonifactor longoviformis]|uniref:glycosyltransferase family 4 protein n=1 Tax=Lactonifactor longoviformis TaxID=341220 RepID=UPI001D01563D|nr:glycosyltransferase family 4 protein [Lactonifactor longoviformis]MCB5714974.1 glycosyltransferase family 4 protein [Lactonifactor longoviformis]MCB5718928.1 glycosyltransferase family 4 protein [Lactonifactor longoviformis]